MCCVAMLLLPYATWGLLLMVAGRSSRSKPIFDHFDLPDCRTVDLLTKTILNQFLLHMQRTVGLSDSTVPTLQVGLDAEQLEVRPDSGSRRQLGTSVGRSGHVDGLRPHK